MEIITWILGASSLVVSRFFKESFFSEGLAFGLIFFLLAFWWFVIPFVTGKDMALPSFADTIFVKGQDDPIRWAFFVLGLFMFFICLSVS